MLDFVKSTQCQGEEDMYFLNWTSFSHMLSYLEYCFLTQQFLLLQNMTTHFSSLQIHRHMSVSPAAHQFVCFKEGREMWKACFLSSESSEQCEGNNEETQWVKRTPTINSFLLDELLHKSVIIVMQTFIAVFLILKEL